MSAAKDLRETLTGRWAMKVYCARPRRCFRTSLDYHQLARVAEAFPDAELADPAVLFESNEHWLAEWPGILASLDLVVAWANEDGSLSDGVLKELADAVGACVPIVVLDAEGRLRCFGGVICNRLLPSRQHIGELLYGEALSVAAVSVAAAIGADVRSPAGALP